MNREQFKQLMNQFESMKELDSRVFVEIPQPEIESPSDYQDWLINLETKWMKEFNSKNQYYDTDRVFNEEYGISGYFGDIYMGHCKLYRFDGRIIGLSEDDYRAKRGVLIRDHYEKFDVVKVQLITNNLIEFLEQEGIKYNKTNFKRRNLCC
jgi:hypothetical protein